MKSIALCLLTFFLATPALADQYQIIPLISYLQNNVTGRTLHTALVLNQGTGNLIYCYATDPFKAYLREIKDSLRLSAWDERGAFAVDGYATSRRLAGRSNQRHSDILWGDGANPPDST